MAQQASEWWQSLTWQPGQGGVPPSTPPAGQPTNADEIHRAMFAKMADTPPPTQRSVPDYPGASAFVQGMIKRGWSPQEAAGAAGNVHVESGFRPEVKSSSPKEQSYGFMQWNHERLAGLKNMAEARGADWTDPEVQMDYINMERTGESKKFGGSDERSAYRRAFEDGGSASEIAERFGRYVERPWRLADSLEIRKLAAEQYFAGV